MNQISTKNLNGVIALNEEQMIVTLGAGSKYGDFASKMYEKGYALHNLASLPHILVSSACATATHGSGEANGNLATAVTAVEMIHGKGELIQLKKGDEVFYGTEVGLGAHEIVTKMTLANQKTFDVGRYVYQYLHLQSLKDNFDDILSGGYSVSLFTHWQNQKINQVWGKRRTDEEVKHLGNHYFGVKAATRNLHPIKELSAVNCADQMGVPGPWYDRPPYFKMGFTPSSGEELQT